MSGESIQVVKSIALDIEGDRVVMELFCSSELGASVLFDDLKERLTSGRPVVITITAGKVIEEGDRS